MKLEGGTAMGKVIILTTFLAFGLARSVYADSCPEQPTLDQEIQRSDYVFVAKVIGMGEMDSDQDFFRTIRRVLLLEVEQLWRGVPRLWITLHRRTPADFVNPFEMNKKYLVFARFELDPYFNLPNQTVIDDSQPILTTPPCWRIEEVRGQSPIFPNYDSWLYDNQNGFRRLGAKH